MYQHLTYQKIHIFLGSLLLIITLLTTFHNSVTLAGIQVQSRYDELSNSQGGIVATHNIGFTYTNTSTPVGSILIQFCDNSPLIGLPCNFPVGMDVSGAILSNQTGNGGYSILSTSGGQILLTRNPSAPNNNPSSYTFQNITNPTSPGEYFMRIQTLSSTDGTGPFVEQGGDAFAITSRFTISAIVPPYLTFCGGVIVTAFNCGSAIGNEISFGDFSSNATSDATSQFVVATNAGNGYSVSVNGDTMTSGNFTISGLSSPSRSKIGTSQFGINLVTNTQPNVGSNPVGRGIGTPTINYNNSNYFTFNDGDTVVSSVTASDFNEFTASYVVNIDSGQPEGVYTTTLYYICLANF